MTDRKEPCTEERRQRITDNVQQYIIIEHVHPLKERMIGMEKTIEYHNREITDIHKSLKELKSEVREGVDLARKNGVLSQKIWNTMLGSGMAIVGGWAIIEFGASVIKMFMG